MGDEELINQFTEVKECEYKGRHYLVRDNGAILGVPKFGVPSTRWDNIWTFGVEDSRTRLCCVVQSRGPTGLWAVQDGGIYLTISAAIKMGKYTHYWYCSSSSDESPVLNDDFYVTFHEVLRNWDSLLHFKKQ